MKCLILSLQTLVLFSFSSQAFSAAQFVESSYVFNRQEGRVHVTCNDGNNYSYNSFWCEGSYSDPAMGAYFKTDLGSSARRVFIQFQSADGKISDTWSLNRLTHKTYFPIPLTGGGGFLKEGENLINYKIMNKKDESLEVGEFRTELFIPPVRKCSPIYLRSVESQDCSSPAFACRALNYPRTECQAQ